MKSQILSTALAALACTATVTPNTSACTMFVLTNTERTLFFNNEDWENPNTRIWFVPAGKGYHSCAYVGFDNGWAQGGVNTTGLAFDWVAGFEEQWEPPADMLPVWGNPSQRMLETCATVDEAIDYFQRHRESSFTYAKIMVADRGGASAIIGARNGELQFEKMNDNRGFGYGRRTLEQMLAEPLKPTLANGVEILQACLQAGRYATKYSSVYDLNTGEIAIYQFPDQGDAVRLNLADELEKGGHYYDLPELRGQLDQALRPLTGNMVRVFLDQVSTIPDHDPAVTKRIGRMLQDGMAGTPRLEDYTAEFWEQIAPRKADLQAELNALGDLVSMRPVERGEQGGRQSYRYLLKFEHADVVMRYEFDEENRVALVQTEAVEPHREQP